MKNLNKKQLQYSARRVFADRLKKMLLLYALVFSIFSASAAVSYFKGDTNDGIVSLLTGAGSANLAITMAAIGDIADVTDKYTQPNQIGYDIMLVETSQIDTSVAFPLPNASRQVSDIPLSAGEYPHRFQGHAYPTYSSTGELGDYTFSPTKEFVLVLGDSSRDQVLNFVEEKAGGKFIVFFKKCESTQWYIIGNYDKPMRFSSKEVKLDGDASVAICKFTNSSMNEYYKYTGTLQQIAPVTLTADVINLAVTSNGKYNTSSVNTVSTKTIATVSGIAAADYGRYITIYGMGGTYKHAIADNTVFILKDGVTWTGNAGSSITFQIVDTATLVEESRVQTA